jgi:predicted nucleotidyltransferase component of viral defense system
MSYWQNNKEIWERLIKLISNETGNSPLIVEKDVVQSLILKELAQSELPFTFKGGTSLSKVYGIIDRFSEDLDISLPIKATNGIKQKAKDEIFNIINKYDFYFENPDRIQSRRNFNRYTLKYDSLFLEKPMDLLIETTYLSVAYPVQKLNVGSIIGKYCNEHNIKMPEEFPLTGVIMNVQSLERTFVDKIFAICDYYLTDRVENHSRHLYDIAMLLQHIDLSEDVFTLIEKVRNERQSSDRNVSSQQQYDISSLLNEIIEKDIYKDDYNKITMNLLYKPYSYENAIKNGIQIVRDSKIFSKENIDENIDDDFTNR